MIRKGVQGLVVGWQEEDGEAEDASVLRSGFLWISVFVHARNAYNIVRTSAWRSICVQRHSAVMFQTCFKER